MPMTLDQTLTCWQVCPAHCLCRPLGPKLQENLLTYEDVRKSDIFFSFKKNGTQFKPTIPSVDLENKYLDACPWALKFPRMSVFILDYKFQQVTVTGYL